jgi:hypothetical protein
MSNPPPIEKGGKGFDSFSPLFLRTYYFSVIPFITNDPAGFEIPVSQYFASVADHTGLLATRESTAPSSSHCLLLCFCSRGKSFLLTSVYCYTVQTGSSLFYKRLSYDY